MRGSRAGWGSGSEHRRRDRTGRMIRGRSTGLKLGLGFLHGLQLLGDGVRQCPTLNCVGTYLVESKVLQEGSPGRVGVEDTQHLLTSFRK